MSMSIETVQIDDATFEAHRGTPESLRAVGERLAAAGAVETWWRPQIRHYVRTVLPHLDADGDLVLFNDDETTSEESFDYLDYPDKAARHLVHADGLGVTFMSLNGRAAMRSHRVAAAVPDTDQVQYRNGYAAQVQWMTGKDRTVIEHALAERQATVDHGSAYNRGATQALRDHLKRLEGTPR